MVNLENVKVNDIVRYQHCMSVNNYYSKVKRVTKTYIILHDNIKFRIKDGRGTSTNSSYFIEGINDQEECYEQDLANLYYY